MILIGTVCGNGMIPGMRPSAGGRRHCGHFAWDEEIPHQLWHGIKNSILAMYQGGSNIAGGVG